MIRRRGRAALLAGVLLLAAAGSGCEGRRLLLTLDLRSFLDPEAQNFVYGEDPPIPPGEAFASVTLANEEVSLVQGLGEVVEVTAGTLHIRGRLENETGSAAGTLALYLAPPGEPVFRFANLVLQIPIVVGPGGSTPVEASVELPERVLDLLETDAVRAALELEVDATGSGDFVRGVAVIERLEAIVQAKQSVVQ
jgi:hypothetical protein